MSESELTALPMTDFVAQLAGGAPTPGGGSASALAGAMAAALVAMVARLTIGRPGYAGEEAQAREILADSERLHAELMALVQRDADAYMALVEARRLPKEAPAQRASRAAAVETAGTMATEVPLETARLAGEALKLALRIAPIGNRNAVSDAGVAALLAAASARGAALNVRINVPGLAPDAPLREAAANELDSIEADVSRDEAQALADVAERMA
jgi:glutamate formiminotransferase/formiminotetrahydrofolate cyclodeaminase